jgi:hypothetical protein
MHGEYKVRKCTLLFALFDRNGVSGNNVLQNE